MNRRAPVADAETVEQNALVTCARDGRTHAVAHAVLSESLAAGTGHCTAVCGHMVLPASLSSPPGSRCALCDEATVVPLDTRRDSRRRWGTRRPYLRPQF
ncbi:hypothetical protein [Pseudonocardia endophytica]|uniref:Uncharacterized protein n=1 Tax=Pseudonocardia endophytica TaxID=401976 RepID=A0A4R1HIA5_PSEEN|nr:hypothetical protein [Pseudonocardia endophytica]TCK20040.1 hypothetical protein EV378_3988 [Pseudonocardia endophytica]